MMTDVNEFPEECVHDAIQKRRALVARIRVVASKLAKAFGIAEPKLAEYRRSVYRIESDVVVVLLPSGNVIWFPTRYLWSGVPDKQEVDLDRDRLHSRLAEILADLTLDAELTRE